MNMKLEIIAFIFAVLVGLSEAQYRYYYLEHYCNGGRGTGHLDLSQQQVGYGLMRVTPRDGYSRYMDCWVRVTAPPGKGIVIRINYVDIYRPLLSHCTSDYLEIFTEVGSDRTPVGGYICGTGAPVNALYFEHGVLVLHFVSGTWFFPNYRRGFELVFTSYRKPIERIGNRTVEGDCRNSSVLNSEFECVARPEGRKMCIPDQLRCDQQDNCGDFSDERSARARCPHGGLSGGAIAGIVLGVLGFTVLICLCVGFIITRSSHNLKAHSRSPARVAMVQMPVAEVTGGAEPPPVYTTTTTTHSFNNAAFVAPPPYTATAEATAASAQGPMNTIAAKN